MDRITTDQYVNSKEELKMVYFKSVGPQTGYSTRKLELSFLKLESQEQPVGLFLKKGIFAKIF